LPFLKYRKFSDMTRTFEIICKTNFLVIYAFNTHFR
jgi:hypothetical protein